MKRNSRIVAIALATAVVAPSASAVNILVNPGFETGTISPWFNDREFGTSGSGQLWQAVNTDSNTGTWSAMVESNKEMRQNFGTAVSVALVTEASVWVKVPEPDGVFGVWLYYTDTTEEIIVFSTANTGWNKYDVTTDLDAGKTLMGFGVNGYQGGGADPDIVFADDAVVDAVPEPASMIALGLGAVALLRRRKKSS